MQPGKRVQVVQIVSSLAIVGSRKGEVELIIAVVDSAIEIKFICQYIFFDLNKKWCDSTAGSCGVFMGGGGGGDW